MFEGGEEAALNIFTQKNYRDILRQSFEARIERTGSHSMRAFAKDLGLPAPRLCQILQKTDGLSRTSARKVAGRLGFNASETDYFCDLVEAQHARSRVGKEQAQARVEAKLIAEELSKEQIDADQIIRRWHHFAILELTNVSGFKSDVKWIARSLRISEMDAALAVDRLLHHGLLTRKRGRLVASHAQSSTTTDVPSAAIRQHHASMLARAAEILERAPLEDRDFSTMIVAGTKSDMPRLKSEIKKFRRALARLVEESTGPKDCLYSLAIQLFNLKD